MFLGHGTFGTVYTRLPFHDEHIDNVGHLNEASKIFHCDDTYTISAAVIHRLERHLNPEQIQELHKYFIMPIRFGRINLLSPIPYHKESPLLWKGDSIYYEEKHKFVTQQITYPLGRPVYTTSTVFMDYTDEQIYIQILYLLGGLHKLHSHDFVHTDIKFMNVVDIDGVWKLADSGDLYHIHDTAWYFKERQYIMANNYTYLYYSPYVYWLKDSPNNIEYVRLMTRNDIRKRHKLFEWIQVPLFRYNILELPDDELLELADTFYTIKTYVCCGTIIPDTPYKNDTLDYLNRMSISKLFHGPKPDNILKTNDLYGLGFMVWSIIEEYFDQKDIKKYILHDMIKLAIKLTLPVLPTL
jgi:hypothetical protein